MPAAVFVMRTSRNRNPFLPHHACCLYLRAQIISSIPHKAQEFEMVARIYQPTKNPMQSGRGKSEDWILEYVRETPRKIEPLMGYTSSTDMKQQIRLNFSSRDEAVAYAERNGIAYQLANQKRRKIRATSYSENFKFDRKQAWTH